MCNQQHKEEGSKDLLLDIRVINLIIKNRKKLFECYVKCKLCAMYLYQFTESDIINSYLIIRNQRP